MASYSIERIRVIIATKSDLHVNAVHVLQIASKPGAGGDVSSPYVADHVGRRKDIVVYQVSGGGVDSCTVSSLHVPVRLGRVDLHGQQQTSKGTQIRVIGGQAEQIGAIVGIDRLQATHKSTK